MVNIPLQSIEKVLVTGGLGFIGSYTVDILVKNGYDVVVLDSLEPQVHQEKIPKYVNKDAMEEVLDIGDMIIAKIWSINKRGIDLSFKSRGLGKIEEGLIFDVNPNKVPRIIGKEGSMIKLIKDNTQCDIQVGQNGSVLIQGPSIDEELFAKKAILYIADNSYLQGLTDALTKWFEENKK